MIPQNAMALGASQVGLLDDALLDGVSGGSFLTWLVETAATHLAWEGVKEGAEAVADFVVDTAKAVTALAKGSGSGAAGPW